MIHGCLPSSDVIQPRQSLLILPGGTQIFIRKSEFRLWVLVGGNLFLERTVGLGRDDSTPVGEFQIVERQKNPTWYRPGQVPIPPGDRRNILGTRWLGFQDTDEFSGFGIHGTQNVTTIGQESSAGCIRMRNEDVELLFDFTPWRTPVSVTE